MYRDSIISNLLMQKLRFTDSNLSNVIHFVSGRDKTETQVLTLLVLELSTN